MPSLGNLSEKEGAEIEEEVQEEPEQPEPSVSSPVDAVPQDPNSTHTILYSNPLSVDAKREPKLYQEAETLMQRIRNAVIAPLFYHKYASFALITLFITLSLACIAAPWFIPGLALGWAIALTVMGGFSALLSSLALYVESHLYGWEDTDSRDEYQELEAQAVQNAEKKYVGHASLSYFRDKDGGQKIPLLKIEADIYHKSGYIQGYILGKQGDKMLSRLKAIFKALRVLNVLGYNMPAWGDEKWTQQFFDPLPQDQKDELNGIVEGHNHWARENKKPLITLGDVMMIHLLPDTHNIRELFLGSEILSSGCTAGLTRDADGTVMHFRNTDWISYNLAGRISILIERNIKGKEHTRISSFPLCIGAEYGENEEGLTLSINVSPGAGVINPKGKIAFCLYRQFLQNCSSVSEVRDLVQSDPKSQPLGPCQLTLSDGENGAIIRFYQKASDEQEAFGSESLSFPGKEGYVFAHDISELSEDNPILVVANEGLEVHEGNLSRGNHHDSAQRIHNVYHIMLQRAGNAPKTSYSTEEAHKALQTPLVNSCETVHSYCKKKDKTYMVSQNGYSAGFFPVAIEAIGITPEPIREDTEELGPLVYGVV